MPLSMDQDRTPTLWAGRGRSNPHNAREAQENLVRIAFINNMPDPALEDTEMQFFDLLEAAGKDLPVHVELYSLPNLPRAERAQQHLNRFYHGTERLLNKQFDGVIITGTEPRQPNLRREPYWPVLAEVLGWAEENTTSAVLSCLSAHAGVLHSDNIERHPLRDKQFGVFTYRKAGTHPLTSGSADHVRFPHSRWNEVNAEALVASGYSVLTESAEAGVDLFVKKKKNSLFVHFQGHPEYGVHTLLKEFRRDVRRFLARERATYPSIPQSYFDGEAVELLNAFRDKAHACREDQLMTEFPEAAVAARVSNTWRRGAVSIYGNWLHYLASRKRPVPAFAGVFRAASG